MLLSWNLSYQLASYLNFFQKDNKNVSKMLVGNYDSLITAFLLPLLIWNNILPSLVNSYICIFSIIYVAMYVKFPNTIFFSNINYHQYHLISNLSFL